MNIRGISSAFNTRTHPVQSSAFMFISGVTKAEMVEAGVEWEKKVLLSLPNPFVLWFFVATM